MSGWPPPGPDGRRGPGGPARRDVPGLPWPPPGTDGPYRGESAPVGGVSASGWAGGIDPPTQPLNSVGAAPGPAEVWEELAPTVAHDVGRRYEDTRGADPDQVYWDHDHPDDDGADPPGPGGGSGSRRRRVGLPLAAVLLLLGGVVAGGLYLFSSVFSTPDYDGAGAGDVIIEIVAGDTTTRIGDELLEKGVVASVDAFTDAAREEERIRSVQPGFYQLRRRISGQAAVALLLDPQARVGQLEIRGGVQLDDTSSPDGTVAPGVLSLIAQASCVTIDGTQSCLTVDELRAAMAGIDPAELGVPGWALDDVAAADPVRRLEGLLVPGRYDVLPGTSAATVLSSLLESSASKLEAAGLLSGARTIGSTPYEVLTIASLVEKEAITADMAKVARVIYNRLGAGQRLELDSMVNYPLDLQALRTTPQDRTRPGPYNSYVVTGLPPTPISAPGEVAISAALAPEPGPWFYFVRCQTDGTSCFAETFAEHDDNVQLARANGAF